MGLRVLSTVLLAGLLAACANDQETTDLSSGSGASNPAPAVTSPGPTVTPVPVQSGPLPGSDEEFVSEVGDRVFFALDMSGLASEAQATLDRQAVWLKSYPGITVTIQGHCDERGTREYNLALGERRAAAVRDYLVGSGIDPGRIGTLSYGKERPVAFGSDEESWAKNRRGVTTIN